MCVMQSEFVAVPCGPTCLGWTFDWMGLVRPCARCHRLGTDREAAAAFRTFMRRYPVPARTEHQCSPTCHGWNLLAREESSVPGSDIEACVGCGLFANDDAALDAAVPWILARLMETAGARETVAGGAPC